MQRHYARFIVLLALLVAAPWLAGTGAAASTVCTPSVAVQLTALETIDGAATAILVNVAARASGYGTTNHLLRISFDGVTNGIVQADGQAVAVPSTIPLPPLSRAWSFELRAVDRGSPFQVMFVAQDQCGEIPKFAGVGSGKVGQPARPVPTPTATPGTTRPAPAAPVALGAYQPAFPDNTQSLDRYERLSGRSMAIVHWYALWGGWKAAFRREDLEAVYARGSVPMITWEPWAGTPADSAWSLRSAILPGRSDAYIESWARGLAAYRRPVLLRFAHEMHHQPSYPWAVGTVGNTVDDYRAVWRYVRSIFARHNATNVQWIWNPNTMGDASTSEYAPVYGALYPGDDAVDWIGLDVYNTGPSLNWGAPYWRTFAQALTPPYQAITAMSSKPLLLGELGSAEVGGQKGPWIGEALGPDLPLRFPRVRAVVWFDVHKEQAWQIESSQAALDAFIAVWRLPHYAGSLPELESTVRR
jgi:beta-mannanase